MNRDETMDKRPSHLHPDIVTEAAAWFVEFRSGDATPAARSRFEQWLRSSPEHVQAYLEVAAGWSTLPTRDTEGRIDLQAWVAAARNSGDDNVVELASSQPTTVPPARHRSRPWALAASIALLVALIGAGLWLYAPQGHTYRTGIGEQRTLMLADGSTIILNALTTVRVHMSPKVRDITLIRGEAYFHDFDDPKRPFIVRSGTSAVRAIGTEFNVERESHDTQVTVVEGQVAVAALPASDNGQTALVRLTVPVARTHAVLVSAGQQVIVRSRKVPVPRSVDIGDAIAWLKQRLIFTNTPLEKVAAQFNLYSKRRLVIADPALRSVGVSGVYSATDPSALIGFLRSQPSVRVVETGNEIVVTRTH